MEAVGLGCFWFARRNFKNESEANSFNPHPYLAEIRKALDGVDKISNLEIEGEGNSFSIFGDVDDEEGIFFQSTITFSSHLTFSCRAAFNRSIHSIEQFQA